MGFKVMPVFFFTQQDDLKIDAVHLEEHIEYLTIKGHHPVHFL